MHMNMSYDVYRSTCVYAYCPADIHVHICTTCRRPSMRWKLGRGMMGINCYGLNRL